MSLRSVSTRAILPPQGTFGKCLKTFLVVTFGEEARVLLNVLQCASEPPQHIITRLKMSTALRDRNTGSEIRQLNRTCSQPFLLCHWATARRPPTLGEYSPGCSIRPRPTRASPGTPAVLVCLGSRVPQTGQLKEQTLISYSSGSWEVQDQGASRFGVW